MLDSIVEKNKGYESPTSLRLTSTGQLEKLIADAYEICFFHHLLAKDRDGSYPDLFCGFGGRDIAISLIAHGYTSSVYAYDSHDDHGFAIVPFTLKDRCACLLIDPASNQDPEAKLNCIYMTVRFGPRWEYRTEWRSGVDVFPNKFLGIVEIIKQENSVNRHGERDVFMKEKPDSLFFERAYDNPASMLTLPELPSISY